MENKDIREVTVGGEIYILDLPGGIVLTRDGEIRDVHRVHDIAGQEMREADTAHEIAAGIEKGTYAKAVNLYKATMEANGKKSSIAEAERLADENLLVPESEVGRTWRERVSAKARRDATTETYWALKRIVDVAIKRMA